MQVTPRTTLAVLGSPIAHSRSPEIHRAAYDVLGLPWTYEAADVTGAALGRYLGSLDAGWRGLSLTMPLKRDVLPLLSWRHPLVDVVGAANTVLLTDEGTRGFNTDVYGVVRSFAEIGVLKLESVQLLGAGATAASVLVAVSELGVKRAVVSARTPGRATGLVALGAAVGIDVVVRGWVTADRSLRAPDAIISTLPGGHNHMVFAEPIRQQSVLFDVAYDPWPSELAKAWGEVGGRVISGLDLLVNQAVGQVRVFVNGDPEHPLPDELAIVAAMRAAVG